MKKPSVEELDQFWRIAVKMPHAPDSIVSLEARLQKAAQEMMDCEDELRDWARMQITEGK
jgi:hypothetical protein